MKMIRRANTHNARSMHGSNFRIVSSSSSSPWPIFYAGSACWSNSRDKSWTWSECKMGNVFRSKMNRR